VRRCAVGTPDRYLERIDGFALPAFAEQDAADQEVRLRFVW
jgi:hypothetical protein